MDQMCLAQAHPTINEQGVVQLTRDGGHVHGRGTGHAVGRAFDQGIKSECTVEPGAKTSACRNIGLHHRVQHQLRLGQGAKSI